MTVLLVQTEGSHQLKRNIDHKKIPKILFFSSFSVYLQHILN